MAAAEVLGRPAAVHQGHEAVHNDGVHGVQRLLRLRQRPLPALAWPLHDPAADTFGMMA